MLCQIGGSACREGTEATQKGDRVARHPRLSLVSFAEL